MRLIEQIADRGANVDAENPVNRRGDICGRDGTTCASLVPVNRSAREPGAGHEHGVTVRPAIAAAFVSTSPRGDLPNPRSSPLRREQNNPPPAARVARPQAAPRASAERDAPKPHRGSSTRFEPASRLDRMLLNQVFTHRVCLLLRQDLGTFAVRVVVSVGGDHDLRSRPPCILAPQPRRGTSARRE